MRVLFQGDSITDCGRERSDFYSMGNGYAKLISESDTHIEWLNRGISGNRVVDLRARWYEDCLGLKPDILSIMIGINDVWRRYDNNDPTSVTAYEEGFRDLLNQAVEKTDAKILLIEPFLLHTPEDRLAWREDLDPKRAVVKKLAEEFGVGFIPLDSVMIAALEKHSPEALAADGVHPTELGHHLIADTWLSYVK